MRSRWKSKGLADQITILTKELVGAGLLQEFTDDDGAADHELTPDCTAISATLPLSDQSEKGAKRYRNNSRLKWFVKPSAASVTTNEERIRLDVNIIVFPTL